MLARYLKGMQDTTVRDTERSGQALTLGAWSKTVALRSRRLSKAKVRELGTTEEAWQKMEGDVRCSFTSACL